MPDSAGSWVLRRDSQPDLSSLLNLYNDAGWRIYTAHPAQLQAALEHSLCVLCAYQRDQLLGLIRVVGDGQSIVYIQDLLVLKAWKRKGIGRALMQAVLNQYSHVRQTVLLTDDSEETRGFYEALGFQPCDQGETLAFVKWGR